MKLSITTMGSAVCLSLACVASVACGSAPQSTGGTEPGGENGSPASTGGAQVASDTINGTLLYTKKLSTDHVIDFYEFAGGATAVRESLSIDSGEKPFFGEGRSFKSLAEAYGQLNPGAPKAPVEVLDADIRSAALAATKALTPVNVAGEVSAPEQEILSAATGTCSDDNFGDGWGGDWFMHGFCNEGAFRNCNTNLPSISTNSFSEPWVSWRQMEGDFNVPGHIHAEQTHCDSWWPGVVACGWVNTVIIDHDVLVRTVETWTWSPASRVNVSGSSPCGHLHFALLWNQ